jgi:large repetitive protein
MNKIFTNSLFLFIFFTLAAFEPVFAQTITVGNVDPGPYAPGSTIGVPITVTGTCVNTTTTYNLYLSDAAGSFANPTLIGSFANFYTTFVNGIIPPGTPAGIGYKVDVISANPTITSTNSAAFSINGGTGVIASVNSQVINPTYPEVFGSCSGVNNTVFSFVDQSTAGAAVTASFFNELSQLPEGSIAPNAAGVSFTAKAAHYTIAVKAVSGGIVGTKSYSLINNAVNTSFGVTGSNTICLGGGGSLTYNVDITSPGGIQNNFPGLVYNIKWGDGNTSSLTLCDVIALAGKISHTYARSSCANNPNGQRNSFEVDLQPSDEYCGAVGTQVTSYARVIAAPKDIISMPAAACVNTPVTFNNISIPGQDPLNTTAGCADANALYTWIVDGVTVASNYPLTQNFINTFTTTGTHSITLHLQNPNALCSATDTTETICIQNPPQPQFTLPVTTGCAPFTVIPTNTSVIDSNCNATNEYVWNVTGPAAISYANGTNSNSAIPQFIFKTPGSYKIQMGITTISCGTVQAPAQTIIVDSTAVAQLSPDVILCGGGSQTFNFNPNKGITQTTLTGSGQNTPGTYKWTVTGGAFTFTGGTSDTSKYPQINFTDPVAYTITVTNTTLCGPIAIATQHITFVQAPLISAGKDTTICGNIASTLHGNIAGVVIREKWVGGTGTFTPGRNALNPKYTPSPAEINAGALTLTLVAITPLAPPCDSIFSSVNLTITKPDSITSAPQDSVCSGVPINYQVTATIPNSTFTWTVNQAKTSATASGYAASGSGTIINDTIINSDPANFATVTYDIIAAGGNGCSSNAFELTVNVATNQSVAKYTQDVTNGCDNVLVQFTNASLPANSNYTWDFGDGSAPSHLTNPSHLFAPRTDGKDTTYNIKLIITSKCQNSIPFTSTLTVRPKTPIAFISPTQIIGCSPFTLAVNNFSPGTNQSYDYYLYDGTTLVQQITVNDKNQVRFNPITTTVTKQYSLYMVATGFCGTTAQSNSIPITVSAPNIFAQMFIENGTTKGCAPFNVTFINNSLGGDNYYYTIYDVNHAVVDRRQGGTAPLPYSFVNPGTFYVSITGSNSCATIESTPMIRIDVNAPPSPQFTADVTTACRNVIVNFTNQTPDDPNVQAISLLYDWDFGDGSVHAFSYTPPPHNYNFKNSPFTVTLTATNSATNCSNTITKTSYINITAPPATEFTENPDSIVSIPDYRFSFIDKTTGNPTSWNWTFGDGHTSTSQNPSHTYLDTGIYKVTLTTATQSGCDSTIIHHIRITGIPGQLFFPNAFEPGSGTVELQTFMAKGSGIREWHMQIFNNFSQLVWETTKLDGKGAPVEGWDGTFKGSAAPQGVYVWQASATFINGTQWNGNIIGNSLPKRTGVIHLIR